MKYNVRATLINPDNEMEYTFNLFMTKISMAMATIAGLRERISIDKSLI